MISYTLYCAVPSSPTLLVHPVHYGEYLKNWKLDCVSFSINLCCRSDRRNSITDHSLLRVRCCISHTFNLVGDACMTCLSAISLLTSDVRRRHVQSLRIQQQLQQQQQRQPRD